MLVPKAEMKAFGKLGVIDCYESVVFCESSEDNNCGFAIFVQVVLSCFFGLKLYFFAGCGSTRLPATLCGSARLVASPCVPKRPESDFFL